MRFHVMQCLIRVSIVCKYPICSTMNFSRTIPYGSVGRVLDCRVASSRLKKGTVSLCKTLYPLLSTDACSTMRVLGVLLSAFSLNPSARQGACKRSRVKPIGVSPENPRLLPKQ